MAITATGELGAKSNRFSSMGGGGTEGVPTAAPHPRQTNNIPMTINSNLKEANRVRLSWICVTQSIKHRTVFLSTGVLQAPKLSQWSPTGAKQAPKLSQRSPTVVSQAPKNSQRSPTGAKQAPKLSQRSPTGAKPAPKISQWSLAKNSAKQTLHLRSIGDT